MNQYDVIIVIGLDGLGRFFDKNNMPNLTNFFKTFGELLEVNAIIPTDSAENWGSILHGVIPIYHKILFENLNKSYNNSRYPSIFKIISDQYRNYNPKLALFCSWNKIITGMVETDITNLITYSPLINENLFSRIYMFLNHYLFKNPIYDTYLVPKVVNFIKNNTDTKFLFIHFDDIDEIGHIHKYKSNKYNLRLKKTDKYLLKIINTIQETWNNPLILITTDHGGINNTHGKDSKEEIEVFICSNHKLKGYDCQENKCVFKIILQSLNIKIPEYFYLNK
jgi:predicted AlkP superfamily pyrophosphatase or phosphodiesterase